MYYVVISLNVKKTEMVIFKSKQKKLEGDLKIKLCSKRLYPTESAKYLGVKNDANFSFQYHVNDLSIKLNRANALVTMLVVTYVSRNILRSIYFAILTPTYPTAVLFGLRIMALFNEL